MANFQSTSEPLFFWGQRGNDSKKCLSNWFPTSFQDSSGRHFSNTEQYMMFHKAILFNDIPKSQEILAVSDPKIIKQKGRQVRNFDGTVWQEHAQKIVYVGCLLKFSQNEDLKIFLLSTGDRLLVEASPYDPIWGIGMNEQEARQTSPDQWKGKNWLGHCLVQVRETLRMNE